MKKTFTFAALPTTVDELRALPEAAMTDPFAVAALALAALCRYEKDAQTAIDMLNILKGPQPLSTYEQQFLRDRLRGKGYVPRSYFDGTSPQNNYEPAVPFITHISDNPYSYQNEGYAVLYVCSSGADSERPIKLRRKGEQWFLWELQCLSDIRKPADEDPWA